MWFFCLLDPFIPTQIKFLATPLLSTWTAAQTAGITLWSQKWLLDRGSEATVANLLQTPLNDGAFQGFFANDARSIPPAAGYEK